VTQYLEITKELGAISETEEKKFCEPLLELEGQYQRNLQTFRDQCGRIG